MNMNKEPSAMTIIFLDKFPGKFYSLFSIDHAEK